MVPLRANLEAACEGLTGNARKIMQVISEDPGITIESLATLVKLTPYGIRYHLAGLAKSVGLHHSNDRKGGVWDVSSSVETSHKSNRVTTLQTTLQTTLRTTLQGRSLEVASYILEHPLSKIQEIADAVGLSRDGVNYQIRILKREVGLRHEGADKNGRWTFRAKLQRKNRKK